MYGFVNEVADDETILVEPLRDEALHELEAVWGTREQVERIGLALKQQNAEFLVVEYDEENMELYEEERNDGPLAG